MKLWLISQTVEHGYDTYDSAVVAAEAEEDAKAIHPNGYGNLLQDKDKCWRGWANNPEDVTAEYLGETIRTEPGVICASYNAG